MASNNDKELFEAALAEKKAETKAHMMVLDMLANIMPDEYRHVFELPKLCNTVVDKVGNLMLIVKAYDSFETSSEYASRACELVNRINDALDAFIEQNHPGAINMPGFFDEM